jgi:alpha-mannosidase
MPEAVPTLPTFGFKAPNVKLETIKRGESDLHSAGDAVTVILRLYEHMGGHASAKLRV